MVRDCLGHAWGILAAPVRAAAGWTGSGLGRKSGFSPKSHDSLGKPRFRALPNVIWETPSAVWETPNVVWWTPSAVWETPSVVWETPSAVWETPNAVRETPSAVWETPNAVRETPDAVRETPGLWPPSSQRQARGTGEGQQAWNTQALKASGQRRRFWFNSHWYNSGLL
jgi:hypothetical protein